MEPGNPHMFGEPPMFVPPAGASLFCIVFTDEGAVIDNGALHGRSAVEAEVEFVDGRDTIGNPGRVPMVWLALEGDPHNLKGYLGLVAVEMLIDREAGRGWKDLAEHSNRMTDAVQGSVDVGLLTPEERAQVRKLLETLDSESLQASPQLLEALGD